MKRHFYVFECSSYVNIGFFERVIFVGRLRIFIFMFLVVYHRQY